MRSGDILRRNCSPFVLSDLFKPPHLAGIAVDFPLLDIGAGTGLCACGLHAAYTAGAFRQQQIRAARLCFELEFLCIAACEEICTFAPFSSAPSATVR